MPENPRRPPTTESMGPSPSGASDKASVTDFEELVRARYRTIPRRGENPSPSPADAVGKKVGSVRLEAVLGVGGMGRVYRGHDERLDRRVAVKTVLHRKRHRQGVRARLRREARLLSRLNHPRICQLFDLVETEEADYLILELVEGETLGEVLDRGPVSRAEGLAHAEEITEALVVAHRRGIVHRDLKPDNVMITPNRGIKVLDFGIARSEESETILDEEGSEGDPEIRGQRFRTLKGSVMGTAAYMSPEQARGEPVTPASDIYSLGVVLEELLSGREPVPEGTESKMIIRMVAEGRRPKPPPPLPRRFTQLVARLQAVDPSDRPAAAEALAAIRRLRNRTKRILRHSLAAISLLVVAAGVTKYTVDLRVEKRRAQEARTQAEALISFLLEDLHEGLEPLGRLDLLDRVARRSLAYFEAAPDQVQVAAEAEALRQLGRVLVDRGDLDASLAAFERARDLDAAHLRAAPEDRLRLLALAQDEREIAEVLAGRGEIARAIEVSEVALGYLRSVPIEDAEIRRELAALLSFELAAFQRDLGDLVGAQASLEEAFEILESLIASAPDDREVLVTLGRYHYAYGLFSFFELGQVEASLEHFRDAIEVYSALEAMDPLHADYRFRLAVLHGQGLCSVLGVQGRSEEAFDACDEALGRLLELHRGDPSNGRWAHALGWEYIRRSDLMIGAGQEEQALDAARRAVEIHGEIARRAPNNADWQGGFAIACLSEAEIRAGRGEWVEATDLLERARRIQSRFAADDASGAWLSELASTDIQLGRLRLLQGEKETARQDFERALEESERLFAIDSARAVVRAELAHALASVGAALFELGSDEERARVGLERSLDLLEGFEEPDGRVLETRALAFLLLGRVDEAREEIGAMQRRGMTPGEAQPALVTLCLDQGITLR